MSFTAETLSVGGDLAPELVIQRVQELGYGVELIDSDRAEGRQDQDREAPRNFFQYMWARSDTRLALLAALLVLPGLIFHELFPGLGIHHFLVDILSVVAMLIAGYPVIRSAFRALRINHEININVLMTIAAVGAVIIGAYTEAAVVMVLFVIGEAMEGYTAERARGSIRTLMDVAPREAIRLDRHDNQVIETVVFVDDLAIGDRIVVKPGARIPMDGRVMDGVSAVNQAPITGESRLIDKVAGDKVFASSVNGEGTLEVEVTHLAEDNTISRLIRMVEEAQEKRAPTQRFIDRFARYYTPAVVVIAMLVAIIPPLFFGQPFLNPDATTEGWLYRALALLVVACPCALIISTPVTLVSAISNGARHGVLFKGGVYLEILSRIQAIALDKTGTLTRGTPAVVAVRAISCVDPESARCDSCDDLLSLATAVERRSEHPLALAIVEEATKRDLHSNYPAASTVTALTGRGVRGEINGEQITIGSHSYFDDNIPHSFEHCTDIGEVDALGYTTMLISSGDDYLGYIAVADTVRDSSRAAIARLQAMGIGHLVMLTGDNAATAQAVAREVGVTTVQANCLPEDKVRVVTELRQHYGDVAMVGDGINDAPALAAASVGIAIGNTAQAMETADVTLMQESLTPLPFAIQLSRSAMRTVHINVVLSLVIKFIVFALVLIGTGTMWMAVLADVGMSLLVTLNGMRLLKWPVMQSEDGGE